MNDVVAEDLEIRVETCAGVLLRRVVDNEVEEDLAVSITLSSIVIDLREQWFRDG